MKIAFISSLKGTSCSLNIVLRCASIFVNQGFLLLLGQYKPIQPGPASGTFTTLTASVGYKLFNFKLVGSNLSKTA